LTLVTWTAAFVAAIGLSPISAVAQTAAIEVVAIPGGCTVVGCPRDRDVCTKTLTGPFRRVCLDPFTIDRTEVTVAQYGRCVAAGACTDVQSLPDGGPVNSHRPGRDQHPVTGVSWAQADAYCRSVGKRLPTEAEWERAARGPAADGRPFPWGNHTSTCKHAVLHVSGEEERCWHGGWNEQPHTSPVCSRPKGNSAEGLCDMIGNVPEWVSDWYVSADSMKGASGRNPRGPCPGRKRCPGARAHVIKGGGWRDNELFARVYNRNNPTKPYIAYDAGFRCVSDGKLAWVASRETRSRDRPRRYNHEGAAGVARDARFRGGHARHPDTSGCLRLPKNHLRQ
jgi:formylglycine-generating enzyme